MSEEHTRELYAELSPVSSSFNEKHHYNDFESIEYPTSKQKGKNMKKVAKKKKVSKKQNTKSKKEVKVLYDWYIPEEHSTLLDHLGDGFDELKEDTNNFRKEILHYFNNEPAEKTYHEVKITIEVSEPKTMKFDKAKKTNSKIEG